MPDFSFTQTMGKRWTLRDGRRLIASGSILSFGAIRMAIFMNQVYRTSQATIKCRNLENAIRTRSPAASRLPFFCRLPAGRTAQLILNWNLLIFHDGSNHWTLLQGTKEKPTDSPKCKMKNWREKLILFFFFIVHKMNEKGTHIKCILT